MELGRRAGSKLIGFDLRRDDVKNYWLRTSAAVLFTLAVAGCGGGGGGGTDTGGVTPPPVASGPLRSALDSAASSPANDTSTSDSASFTVLQNAGLPAVVINSPPKVNFAVFSENATAMDLCLSIHRDFAYDKKATKVETTPIEAFQLKRGVCQDFAQIMISGLRAAGLPAAYVSGYIRTLPPPGQPRLVGADATHAWVLVWAGPQLGWVGVDPTNGIWMAGDHIVVAIGRDYADVAPIDGIVLGWGAQEMHVSVDVEPLEQFVT